MVVGLAPLLLLAFLFCKFNKIYLKIGALNSPTKIVRAKAKTKTEIV